MQISFEKPHISIYIVKTELKNCKTNSNITERNIYKKIINERPNETKLVHLKTLAHKERYGYNMKAHLKAKNLMVK